MTEIPEVSKTLYLTVSLIFSKLFSVAKGEIYYASGRNKLNVAGNSPKNQLIITF